MMKCKFYFEKDSKRLCKRWNDDDRECVFKSYDEDECYARFFPKMTEHGSSDVYGDTIAFPKYSARISIGNFQINLTDKTFTEEQTKNMKEMLGWEVENL